MLGDKIKTKVQESVEKMWDALNEEGRGGKAPTSKRPGSKSAGDRGKGWSPNAAYYGKMHGPFDSRGPGPIINLILKGGKRGKKGKGKKFAKKRGKK